MPNGFIIQSGAAGAPKAVDPSIGQGMPSQIGGQPVKYAWKEMIRVGQYTHPRQGWTLSVTPDRLKTWEQNFHAMKQNGVKPFLPAKHVDEFSGAENYGYLIDMRIAGDKLEGLHQLIGEDAHRAAARNESSVYIQPNVKDAKGNTYSEAITHNAIIPDPVVTGLGGFVALSASASADSAVPVYTLAGSHEIMTEEMKQLRILCGLPDTADEKTILAAVATRITGDVQKLALSVSAQNTAAQAQRDAEARAATAEAARVLAENKASQAEARALSLSGGSAMPDDLATAWHGVYENKIDGLAVAGHITPDCRDAIKATVLKAGGKVNGLALSKSTGGKSIIELVIDALAKNRAIPMGKMAGAQALSTSAVAKQGAAGADAAVETLDKPSEATEARCKRLGLPAPK